MVSWKRLLVVGQAIVASVLALDLDITDPQSIFNAQALVAQGMLDYYNGNNSGGTPGMFQPPYYWWEAGVAWGSLIDYWFYTGNDTFNDLVKSSLLFQVGEDWDYMPANQTSTEGNDDQGFWGVAVMGAAEKNFSNPGPGQPSWLYLAQAVFNTMASRWDSADCNGGLRWQIFTWNTGYDYKNSVSNGCLFHIGARLARYTSNSTYVKWCEKVWDWEIESGFIQNGTAANTSLSVYDGADIAKNCTDIAKLEWTYNYGLFISGAAYLYDHTNDTKWLTRAELLWNRATVFFHQPGNILYEAACQPSGRCNNDQRCFKGIFARFLGLTVKLLPSMNEEIMTYINDTSVGVAQSCSGGYDGHTCGLNWFYGGWDGMYGLGEQISALDLLNTLLVNTKPGPLSQKTGATSRGDGSAGTNSSSNLQTPTALKIYTKDKAGAGVITAVVLICMIGSTWWMMV
ncbi:mannan endo-1,6-alpha-mannosidase Dcw1p [Trichomonascus vanleenenianus]|uniref:glycoside hydrolase family 76 protein n=1 Tax=Trichomonascus vanleenenianus TaxID=2268995 RepID=UPI003ECB4DDB